MSESNAIMYRTQRSAGPAVPPLISAIEVAERRQPESGTRINLKCGAYAVRLADCGEDLRAVCRLRFLVFNVELNEGLESAYETGYDSDLFDRVCDHLVVEHSATGQVVGTYRMQSGLVAGRRLGYYSAREFDFSPYEAIRDEMIEAGRAAIHRDHRSFQVLTLLWRGLAAYAAQRNARYLIGCSSLTSQNAQDGPAMFWRLRRFQTEPALRTHPRPGFECSMEPLDAGAPIPKPPRLLRAYLSIGARICGRPAIDREFKTIDFLTLLDLDQLGPFARLRFLR